MDTRDLKAIEVATAAGVKAAIADPATWTAGFAALQDALGQAAARESGKWLIGWLGWLFKRAVGFCVVLGALYYTGGLTAVITFLKLKGSP